MIFFDTFYGMFLSKYSKDNYQKEFTAQSVAKKNAGIFDQIIFHIFKLEYRLNYDYDRDHHISDIATWVMELIYDIYKDKKSYPMIKVLRAYVLESHPEKKLLKWTMILKTKYQFKGQLMQSDLDNAVGIVIDLLNCRSRAEVIFELNKLYPL